jgi:hypothetical protein
MTEEEHDTGSLLPKRQVIEQVALGWACIMYAEEEEEENSFRGRRRRRRKVVYS